MKMPDDRKEKVFGAIWFVCTLIAICILLNSGVSRNLLLTAIYSLGIAFVPSIIIFGTIFDSDVRALWLVLIIAALIALSIAGYISLWRPS